jgi:3-oxoacyl-[acyl-carrier protein] reductase
LTPGDLRVAAQDDVDVAGLELDPESWRRTLAVNVDGVLWCCRAVLPTMRQRGWGRVVNISGTMEPRSLNAASAAKGALHLWAKGLSCDVAAEGVTVNTIQPGRIDSEQIRERLHPTEESRRAFIASNIPIGYFGEPEDIANLAAFLASPRARYITGAVIPVDGGMHFFAH